jgi:hypothetical protein
MHLLEGERGQCSMAGCAPFVRRDNELQVGNALHRDCPILTLKRRAWGTKGILLAQQCLVSMPPVSRDRHLDLLRTARVLFLNLKTEQAQGLGGIEGQEQPLWSRCCSDPAAPSRAAVAIEGVVNRIIGGLRGYPYGRERSDIFFSWLSDSLCWRVREEVFP